MAIQHGVKVVEDTSGGNPVVVPATSVVGLVGYAFQIDKADVGDEGKIVVFTSYSQAESRIGVNTSDDGTGDLKEFKANSLLNSLAAIFDQAQGIVVCVAVNKATPEFFSKGVSRLLAAESETGYKPKIILAPGLSEEDTGYSVAENLKTVAANLGAIALYDLPDSAVSDTTVTAGAKTKIGEFNERMYVLWPSVYATNSAGKEQLQPMSPRVAGAIVRSDTERGWWWSPSNYEVFGVLRTKNAVSFGFGSGNSLADILNGERITTMVRRNGYRIWGNRTCAGENDKYTFLVVRRTADIIHESVLTSHLWAVDRNITRTYLQDVTESNNDFLRTLRVQGAILGGRCWVDPEKNPASEIKQGKVKFDFDFTPNYPAENVTFTSHLVDNYIAEIFK